MTAPCVTDAQMIRIMANYLRGIDGNSSRLNMVADTLTRCAGRVEQSAKAHADTRNELDALIDVAGDKIRLTEIAETVLNRLPEWLTIKHEGAG